MTGLDGLLEKTFRIDYALMIHYNTTEDQHGWTVKFFSKEICDEVFDRFGIIAEPRKTYRIHEHTIYINLREFLSESCCFSGTFGDDSWPLFAEERLEYWESIRGKGFLEKDYPLYGQKLWDSLEDLNFGK